MAEIHHFDYGWVTPTFSYVLSALGSLLGLICAVRLRSAPSAGWRAWWLSLAAVAIGGTGIWAMHFVAMLGFSVVGSPIRYDVGVNAASAAIAIVAVGIGLIVVFVGSRAKLARIAIGGVIAGLGVGAMHYTGMAAMRLDGDITYRSSRVAESIAIAIIAATVALWLTATVQRPVVIVASALIMGIAVNGMHFTGMSAMSVHAHERSGSLSGATVSSLLIPIGLAVVFAVIGLIYALMAAPNDQDRAGAAYLAARLAEKEAVRGEPGQQANRPAPTLGGAWTYRDRSNK
jgi:NO-binding membrane sensor protein with MHYT domain